MYICLQNNAASKPIVLNLVVINVTFFSENKNLSQFNDPVQSVHCLLYFMKSNLPVMVGDNQNIRK